MSKQLKVEMLKREHGNYVCWCLKNNKVPQTFSEFVEDIINIVERERQKKLLKTNKCEVK